MITIFCGEDTATSRNKFIEKKQYFIDKGYEIAYVTPDTLNNFVGEIASTGLFFAEKVFFGENILNLKKNRDILKNYESEDFDIFLFESKLKDRDLKFVFTKSKIITSKFQDNVFTFLDSIYQTNLTKAIEQLDSVWTDDEEFLVYYLLKSRIKELILIKKGIPSQKKQAVWQIGKLKQQAEKWDENKLMTFYDNLYKIEKNIKTSSNVYPIKKSLEILFCFYL